MNAYTPAELALADQVQASITEEVAKLAAQAKDDDHGPEGVEELAAVLLESLTPDLLAITLSIAIHQLARRQP